MDLLSDTAIRSIKPKDKPYKVTDGGGLYLLVTTSGSKLWRFDYRRLGKRLTMAMGAYPDLTLKRARKDRDEAREHLANGLDPIAQRKLKETAAKTAEASTFNLIADEFLEKIKADGLSEDTINKNSWMLDFAREEFGTKAISAVTAAEILLVLKRIEKAGKHDTAVRTRSTIGRVFRYAIATSRAERDPSVDLRGALVSPKTKHHAALFKPEDVGALMRSINDYRGTAVVRLALRIAPHIFLRPFELRYSPWEELPPLKYGMDWRIPGSRMKTKDGDEFDHILPCSRQVVDMLRELKELTGHGKYLFPSNRSTKRPISEVTLNAAFRRMGYTTDEVTTHGLRRTASTLLNEQILGDHRRFDEDWIETQLHHLDPNAVRGTYNAAEYLEPRRKMMQWWSDYLDRLAGVSELLG